MENPGEQIVGEYLKWIKRCDFVSYNTPTQDEQGEIDVIGINIAEKKVYVCEVATHMQTGINYVNPKSKESDNVNRFIKKFSKDIQYAKTRFPSYDKHFMLWTPLVKINKEGSKANQHKDIEDILRSIRSSQGAEIEVVSNRKYYDCIQELRAFAKKETKDMKNPIMKFCQIEEKLKKYMDFHKM